MSDIKNSTTRFRVVCPACGRTFDPEGEVLYDAEGRVYEGEDYD